MLLNLYGLTTYGQEGIIHSSAKCDCAATRNWTPELKVVFISTLLLLLEKAD